MKVFIDQTKPKLGDTQYNLNMILETVEKAIGEKNDIVVFPELTLTGHNLEDITFDVGIENVPEILLEKSREIDIIFGCVEAGESDYPYNTAYYLSKGKIIGKHRKVYLSNYGGNCESRCFMSGDRFESIHTEFGKVGILIGDEIFHQSAQYILAQQGIKYLFVLVNGVAKLGAFKEDIGKNIKTAAKANSLLNGVFTVVVNRTGIEDGAVFYGNSFVVMPDGEICAQGKYFENSGLSCCLDTGAIRRMRMAFPFFKNEDIRLTIGELKSITKKI